MGMTHPTVDRIAEAHERGHRFVSANLVPLWYRRFLELQQALGLSRADTVRAAIEALWEREHEAQR
jgi:hypothetical protein